MTTINPTGSQVLPEPKQAGALAGADFNMFLKLLTTQMQNQDPLDPMDTSEYTQQLVQYSQVEQSITQTGVLKDILARLSVQDMAQASGFIGREVVIDSAVSGVSAAQPGRWSWEAARPVTTVTAEIYDAKNKLVATPKFEVQPGAGGNFQWDGKLASGAQAEAGAYTLKLKGVDKAGATVPIAIRSQGTVQDVSMAGGKLSVGVNGASLPADRIIRVIVPAQG